MIRPRKGSVVMKMAIKTVAELHPTMTASVLGAMSASK
jgi:hypothetical protein